MFGVTSENCANTMKYLVSVLALYLSISHYRSTVIVRLLNVMLADRTVAGLKMISYVYIEIQRNIYIYMYVYIYIYIYIYI